MYRLILIAITLTLFVCTVYSSPAFALGHVTLGKHNEKDIKKHCDAAGGTPFNQDGVYGCFGPGGDVTCSSKSKKCFGTCEACGSARMSEKDIIPSILGSNWGFFRWTPERRPTGRVF
jgi:hypothetical protein